MRVEFKVSGLEQLEALIKEKMQEVQPKVSRLMTEVGTKWELEAKKRVPVDTGLLRNTILKDTGWDKDGPYVAVGSNQKYAKFVEFGTEHIAGGRVMALGTGEEITDSQAVKSWPAKMAGLKGAFYDKLGRLHVKGGKFAAGRQNEQMPWLRPALNSIKAWIVDKVVRVFQF